MNLIFVLERVKEVKILDLDYDILLIERVFGVQWCVEFDFFNFKLELNK